MATNSVPAQDESNNKLSRASQSSMAVPNTSVSHAREVSVPDGDLTVTAPLLGVEADYLHDDSILSTGDSNSVIGGSQTRGKYIHFDAGSTPAGIRKIGIRAGLLSSPDMRSMAAQVPTPPQPQLSAMFFPKITRHEAIVGSPRTMDASVSSPSPLRVPTKAIFRPVTKPVTESTSISSGSSQTDWVLPRLRFVDAPSSIGSSITQPIPVIPLARSSIGPGFSSSPPKSSPPNAENRDKAKEEFSDDASEPPKKIRKKRKSSNAAPKKRQPLAVRSMNTPEASQAKIPVKKVTKNSVKQPVWSNAKASKAETAMVSKARNRPRAKSGGRKDEPSEVPQATPSVVTNYALDSSTSAKPVRESRLCNPDRNSQQRNIHTGSVSKRLSAVIGLLDMSTRKDDTEQRRGPGRKSNGCWTCKCRRKKCDETHPTCVACGLLGLTCDGYDKKRPIFMTDPQVNHEYRQKLAEIVKKQQS